MILAEFTPELASYDRPDDFLHLHFDLNWTYSSDMDFVAPYWDLGRGIMDLKVTLAVGIVRDMIWKFLRIQNEIVNTNYPSAVQIGLVYSVKGTCFLQFCFSLLAVLWRQSSRTVRSLLRTPCTNCFHRRVCSMSISQELLHCKNYSTEQRAVRSGGSSKQHKSNRPIRKSWGGPVHFIIRSIYMRTIRHLQPQRPPKSSTRQLNYKRSSSSRLA